MNAARARKRTKDQIQGLRKQVADHAESNNLLQRKNKELTERLDKLESENKLLRAKVFGNGMDLGKSFLSGMGGMSDTSMMPGSSLKDRLSVLQPQLHASMANGSFLGGLNLSSAAAGLGGLHPSIQQHLSAQLNDSMEAEKKQALLRLILSASSA